MKNELSKLNEFISKNKYCPICGNLLTLFLQFEDSVCFKSSNYFDREIGFIRFDSFKCNKLKSISTLLKKFDNDYVDHNDYVDITILNDSLNMNFSSDLVKNDLITAKSLYFYYLCNPSSFRDLYNDYEIILYNACYYLTTNIINITIENSNIKLNIDDNNDIIGSEHFCIKSIDDNTEKVYMVSSDKVLQKTTLNHYINHNSMKASNILEKELPILPKPLDLSIENRDKLIEKLNYWILMT